MTLPFNAEDAISHPFSLGENNHAILGNPNASGTFYADIAARDADTDFQLLENVGKAVAVTSPLSIFVLMSVGPAVWLELSSTAFDTWAEVLAGGNVSGGTDPIVSAGDDLLVTDHMSVGGITAPALDTSIDLKATNAALLLNRLTTTQRDALTPLAGMEIFNTTTLRAEGYNGTVWTSVGDVIGPATSTDNALARFDLATGKLIQNSVALLSDAGDLTNLVQVQVGDLALIGGTILNGVGSVTIESSADDVLVMKGPGIGGTPVLFDVLTGITVTGKFGDLGTSGIDLTAGFAQFGWKNFADLEIAPASDAASDIAFYTPNVGLTSLVERMRIKTATGAVGIGGSPDASALLDLISTTLGFLPMRMTTTERDAISSPATGLQIDNTTVNELQRFNGSAWIDISPGGDVDGPASSTDNGIVTFDGVTGKLIQEADLTLLAQTIRPISVDPIDFVLKSNTPSTSSLICFEDSLTRRMEVGNKSTTVFETTLVTSQIIQNNTDTNLHIATRGNFLSDMVFYTSPGVSGLLERMRIGGALGHVGIGRAPTTTDRLCVRNPVDSTDEFISVGDQIPRVRIGQRLGVIPTSNVTAEIVTDGFGNLALRAPSNSAKSMLFYTGTTTSVLRMTLDAVGNVLVPTGGTISIGAGTPQGLLNVVRAASGATVNPLCQEIVAEHLFDAGISILTGDTGRNRICFGDVTNNTSGLISYDHNTDLMTLSTLGAMTLSAISPILVDSSSTVPLRVRMNGTSGNPSLIQIEDTIIRGQFGYFGSTGAPSGLTQGQIGWGLNGQCIYASRGNFAGGGHIFFTPNAALDTLIQRLRINDDPGSINIWDGSTKGTGQLSVGTDTPVVGAGITVENSTALMCGQLIGATGKWQIKTVAGLVQMGSVQPTPFGILCNNIIRTRWDNVDGRIRNLFGQTSKKTNIADTNYTILSTDYRIATTSITAARIYTLPSAEIAKGSATEAREWKFKDESGNVSVANKITIVTEGSENIDGATDLVVTTAFHDFSLYADGSNVFVEAA